MNKIHTLKTLFFTLICIISLSSCAKKTAVYDIDSQQEAIKKVLYDQQEAWNDGDIEAFMSGYWNSEKLSFVGRSGPTYSWASTLANYQKGYPDKAAMGKLHFDILNMRSLSDKTCYMIGKFTLTRENDTPSGYFTLLWEKKNDQWLITSDHTSG